MRSPFLGDPSLDARQLTLCVGKIYVYLVPPVDKLICLPQTAHTIDYRRHYRPIEGRLAHAGHSPCLSFASATPLTRMQAVILNEKLHAVDAQLSHLVTPFPPVRPEHWIVAGSKHYFGLVISRSCLCNRFRGRKYLPPKNLVFLKQPGDWAVISPTAYQLLLVVFFCNDDI